MPFVWAAGSPGKTGRAGIDNRTTKVNTAASPKKDADNDLPDP